MTHKQIVEDALKTFRPVEDIIRAREFLSMLCKGDRPSMSIPVQADDWDMVLSRVIARAENSIDKTELIEVLEKLERKPVKINNSDTVCMSCKATAEKLGDACGSIGFNTALQVIIKELGG